MLRTSEARNDRLFDHIRDFIARRAVEIVGLLLLLLTAATATALLTWTVSDPSLNHVTSAPVRNFLGLPGAIGADLLMQLFGLASGMILIPIGFASLRMMTSGVLYRPKLRLVLLFVGLILLAGCVSLFPTTQRWPLPTGLGGFLGDTLTDFLIAVLPSEWPKKPVIGLFLSLASLMTLLLVAGIGLGSYEENLASEERRHQQWIDDLKDDERESENSVFTVLVGAVLHIFYSFKSSCSRLFFRKQEDDWITQHPQDRAQDRERIEPAFAPRVSEPNADVSPYDEHDNHPLGIVQTARQKRFDFAVESESPPETVKRKASPAKSQKLVRGSVDEDGYEMPPLTLLTEAKRSLVPLMPPEVLEQNARLLENVLDDFGVRGEIVNVRPGPVVLPMTLRVR
jgi:DNA segregation ATPase FtsK/SpoIIIE, S-DNA-T family